ncbi:MAG: EpsG family protein [Bacteroidales bacterium]|nr:EpsG family protein [Bacteroidales bacterium]
MIELVPLQYYVRVFYYSMFAICLLVGLYYQANPGCEKLLRRNSIFFPLLISIVLIFYMGLRPTSYKFGDMPLYEHRWNMSDSIQVNLFDFRSEWFFDYLMLFCKALVPNAQFWFVVIDFIYIGCQFWACKKLLWENVWLAILFVFYSFQFFSYGTNGLRNGMACSMMILSIAYFCDRNRNSNLIGFLLFGLAMACHRSVIIPMAAVMASKYIIKDIKISIYIWFGCIVLSLIAGGTLQNIIFGLGFDDRMSTYSSIGEETMSEFSHTGFRWDFLLYSAMPLWLAMIVRNKGINDPSFTLLANTYIIANSFWILVCRVAFSNRFAYLSWFLYALVIAYAVVRVPIWKNQDRAAGWILIAHSAFSLIMYIFFK